MKMKNLKYEIQNCIYGPKIPSKIRIKTTYRICGKVLSSIRFTSVPEIRTLIIRNLYYIYG